MVFRLNSYLRHAHAWPKASAVVLISSLSLISPISHAANAPLMQGGGTIITETDVRLEMQRLPPTSQTQLLADPQLMRQLIDNAYLRRSLAAQAEHNGLLQKPELQHLLLSSRENILAEAELTRVAQAARADTTSLDKLARSAYTAEADRFNTPPTTRARHILIKGSDAGARAQADKLLAELRGGSNFETLARQYSADPRSAAQGGDLGFFPKGRMVPSFDAALDKLKNPGDLSDVVPSQFGFHIIRLEERKPASSQPYDEVRSQLYDEITAKLQKTARSLAIERLRAEASGDADQLQNFIEAQKKLLPAEVPSATSVPTNNAPTQ